MAIGTKALDGPKWFFVWASGKPYVTTICSWTRKDCIQYVEEQMREPWRKIYRKGGRIVKCALYPKGEQ